MNSKTFSGTVSQMRNSPWLASEDLLGLGEVEVKIESVHEHRNVKMDGGRTEPVIYALKYEGKDKQMILNATNRKALSHAFGAKTQGWIGQKVFLRAQPGIRKPGTKNETCCGLRIRAEGSKQLSDIVLPEVTNE
jgi:hypothetical protein